MISIPMLLRAELRRGELREITRTIDLRPALATLCGGDAFATGDRVELALSFPHVLPTCVLDGEIVSTRAGGGPGEPRTASVRLLGPDDATARLRDVLERASTRARSEAARGEAKAVSLRCLVVEDSALIGDLFRYALERYAARRAAETALVVASNATEAWRALDASSFDLAFVDHYLPGITGARLIARMRKDPRLAALPVIAMSVGGTAAREEALEAGADVYIDKPVVLRDVTTTLDMLTLHGGE